MAKLSLMSCGREEVTSSLTPVLLLYIGSSTEDKLHCVDYTNTTSPVVVGSCSTCTTINKVVSRGDYVYVAGTADTLDIIDVSDPAVPYVCGSFRGLQITTVLDLILVDNYLIMASKVDDSIVVMDIGNPCNPMMVNIVKDTKITDLTSIVLKGGYLYIGTLANDNFSIWDANDPLNITFVGEIIDTVNANDVTGLAVVDDYAYLLTDDWINVFDVSNKLAPTFVTQAGDVSTISDGRAVLHVNQSGVDYLIVAALTSDNITVWDISNKALPTLALDFRPAQLSAGSLYMAVKDDYMFVAGTSTTTLLDITSVLSPSVLHQYTSSPAVGVGSIAVQDSFPDTAVDSRIVPPLGAVNAPVEDLVYVSATEGVVAVDISDPTTPVTVATIETLTAVDLTVVLGNIVLAYEPTNLCLSVYEYSSSTNIKLINRITHPSLSVIFAMVVKDKVLYCANHGNLGIAAFDISDVKNITYIGSLNDGAYMTNLRDMKLEGNYLHIVSAGDDTYSILDITNPASIQLVGNLELMIDTATVDTKFDTPTALALNGTHAYIGSSSSSYRKLCVVDYTNKAVPFIVNYMDEGILNYDYYSYMARMVTVGDYVICTTDSTNRAYSSTIVLDTTVPAYPECIAYGTIDSVGTFDGVIMSGTNLIGVDGVDNSVAVYDIEDVTTIETQVPGEVISTDFAGAAAITVKDSSVHIAVTETHYTPLLYPPVGTLDTGNSSNTTLFMSGANEIIAIDISNPLSVVQVGSVSLSSADRVVVKDNIMFASVSGADIITSYDVSNPASMVLLQTFSGDGELNGIVGMVIKGSTLFATTNVGDTVTAVNIGNPSAMSIKSSIKDTLVLEGGRDLRFDPSNDDIVYVAATNADCCTAVDISNESAMVVLSSSPEDSVNSDSPWALAVKDNIVYLGCGASDGVCMIDTTTMARLGNLQQDNIYMSKSVEGIIIHGNYMFVCDTDLYTVTVYDVTIPTAPSVLYVVPDMVRVRSCVIVGNYGYFCSETTGSSITIIDFTDMSNPVKLATTVAKIGDVITYNNDPMLVK